MNRAVVHRERWTDTAPRDRVRTPVDEPLRLLVRMNSTVRLSRRMWKIHHFCQFWCCAFHHGARLRMMERFTVYTMTTHLHDLQDFHRPQSCVRRSGLLPDPFVPRRVIIFCPDHSQDASFRSVAAMDSANAVDSSFVDPSLSQP